MGRPLLSQQPDEAEGASRPRVPARFFAPRIGPMPETSKFTVACANLWYHLQRHPP
jgi:hypothetical protein